MSKQKDNKTAEIKPELYTLLGVVNLCGRTQKQQEKIERRLIKKGSLWGEIPCLHKFIFSRKELNQVKRAKTIIDNHKTKCENLNYA